MLIGDPGQLSTFTDQAGDARYIAQFSPLERAAEVGCTVYFFKNAYRGTVNLTRAVSMATFLGNMTVPHARMAMMQELELQNRLWAEYGFPSSMPVVWANVRGRTLWHSSQRERDSEGVLDEEDRVSPFNEEEARVTMKLAIRTKHRFKNMKVRVLTFYANQAALMRSLRDLQGYSEDVDSGIPVHTVDATQGRQADYVFLSTVRSGHGIGFCRNFGRANVALSRATKGIMIVGNATTMVEDQQGSPQLRVMFRIAAENHQFVTPEVVYEWMNQRQQAVFKPYFNPLQIQFDEATFRELWEKMPPLYRRWLEPAATWAHNHWEMENGGIPPAFPRSLVFRLNHPHMVHHHHNN